MSKERFEELAYNVGISQSGEYARMKANDYAFLYDYAKEQAERVEKLTDVLEDRNIRLDYLEDVYKKLIKQNKRYREALEFINEELELVLHSNKGLAEKMFYIENSKRKITEVLEGESE